jgi:hypothetical protein
MSQFKAFAPGVEVNGWTVLSIVKSTGSFENNVLKILAAHGILDPKPDFWYPQQGLLDSLREISEQFGSKMLVQIGRKISENIQYPPQINNIEKALSSIDDTYHMSHRGGEIGHYTFTITGGRAGKMFCNNPHPCDFDRGIILAMSQRFAPIAHAAYVLHDETQPCRKKGADTCTYVIFW